MKLRNEYGKHYPYYQEYIQNSFAGDVVRYGNSVPLNEADREDVKSSLKVKLLETVKKNCEKQKVIHAPKVYYHKVLRNALREILTNDIRRKRQMSEYLKEHQVQIKGNLTRSEHYDVCIEEIREIVQAAELTQKEKAIYGCFLTGMEFKEIAQELGINVESAKKRFQRAKAKILAVLKKYQR